MYLNNDHLEHDNVYIAPLDLFRVFVAAGWVEAGCNESTQRK